MNERIKELAKQSLPEFYLTNCPSALEKFAELIVQECVLVECSLIMKSSKCEVRGMELLIKKIYEHFGVEE